MFINLLIIVLCIVLYFIIHATHPVKNTFAFAQPNCNKACPKNLKPVCGSDGQTYGNPCGFDNANCKAGGKLTSKPGRCPVGAPKSTLPPPTKKISAPTSTLPPPTKKDNCPPGQHIGRIGPKCEPRKPCPAIIRYGCVPDAKAPIQQ